MKSVQYFGTATKQSNGLYKHTIEARELFDTQFAELIGIGAETVEYEANFQRIQVEKTYDQLKYFKGIVRRLLLQGFRDAGYDMGNVEEAENYVKMLFFYREVPNQDGEPFRIPRSLEGASKEELTKFIDECREFSDVALSTYIMTPDDYINYLIEEAKQQSDG